MNSKTILLLGGFGFIGSNILAYIDSHNDLTYEVIIFDNFPNHRGGIRFKCVKKVYSGDFKNTDIIEEIFAQNSIDLVIHSLSATVPIDIHNARFDVESNLIPSLRVLDLMVQYKISDIVFISSGGAIYGSNCGRKHIENEDVFPKSSYGIVKLAVEKYMMQYSQLYDLHPLILRLSNPYGPYHYSTKQGICNVALAAAVRRNTFTVWGSGNGKKDYIYVDDFVDILFSLINKHIYNRILNVGSGQLYSVNEIVERVRLFVPGFVVEYDGPQIYDTEDFELNTMALQKIIGNYRFLSLGEGLQLTYQWEKDVFDKLHLIKE